MDNNGLAVVFIIVFIAVVMTFHMKREVDVTFCESGGLTTYVGLVKPMKGMSFGDCRLLKMSAEKYWDMKRVMRNSNGGGISK